MREGAKGRGLTRMCGCGEEAEVGWDQNIICVGCGRRPATLLWQRENSLYLDRDEMKLEWEVYAIICISFCDDMVDMHCVLKVASTMQTR